MFKIISKALAKLAAIGLSNKGLNAASIDEHLLLEQAKQAYTYVGRGKGGKKRAHTQSGAAAIKRAAKKARNRKRAK